MPSASKIFIKRQIGTNAFCILNFVLEYFSLYKSSIQLAVFLPFLKCRMQVRCKYILDYWHQFIYFLLNLYMWTIMFYVWDLILKHKNGTPVMSWSINRKAQTYNCCPFYDITIENNRNFVVSRSMYSFLQIFLWNVGFWPSC